MNGKTGNGTQAANAGNPKSGKSAGKTNRGHHSDEQDQAEDQGGSPQSNDDSKSDGQAKSKSSDKKSGSSQDSTDPTNGQYAVVSAATNTDSSIDDTPSATDVEADASTVTGAALPTATDADDTDASTGAKDGSTVKTAADNSPSFQNLVAQPGAEPASSARSDAQSPAPTQAPPTPQTASTELDPNVARVARGLQNALQQNGGSVTLRLQPPDLGSVKIQMQIHDGTASVEFQADRPAVSDLLGHQLASLRDARANARVGRRQNGGPDRGPDISDILKLDGSAGGRVG